MAPLWKFKDSFFHFHIWRRGTVRPFPFFVRTGFIRRGAGGVGRLIPAKRMRLKTRESTMKTESEPQSAGCEPTASTTGPARSRLRALPLLAALAVLASSAPPAHGQLTIGDQQPQMLVGNHVYYIDSGGNFQYWVMSFTQLFAGGAIDDLAQEFTTGTHPQGYRIDSASIRLNGPFDPNGFTLELFDGSSQPGRKRFTFRNPPVSPGNGPVTFQAPPAMKLEPNTTYYLLAAAKYEGVGWHYTSSSNRGVVDAGSAAGWSIAGEALFRNAGTSWGKTADRSLIIEINGRPIAADAPPYVNGIDFSSTPAANGNYVAGETISARVSFSEAVTASGSPVLPFTIGTATRNAAYQAMESTATELAFAYTVVAGDRDDDGVSIAANALSGTIRPQGAVTDADLGHGPVADQRPHRVDGIPLVEEPVRVTSSPDAGTWYSSGETIEITVNLTDPVTVSGNPRFRFKLGNGPGHNSGRVIAAAYDAARSTTTSLVFSYTVQTTDADNNGIWIGDGTQTLLLDAADAVRDAAGRSADLNHCIVKTMANHKVHGGPWITGVAVTSSPASGNVYRLGETIEITVTYDQEVTVAGDPEFEFSLGSPGAAAGTGDRRAAYDTGASSAASLVFTYTVLPTDEDSDGIWIGNHTRTLKLDGDDSIVNVHGLNQRTNHREVGRLSAHKVDARPWITGVAVTSSPASGDVYRLGETIEMAVTYDQEVTVSGDPEFEFSLSLPGAAAGTGDRRAAYDAGASSADSLVFTYTVLPTDEDPDGIWIGNHARTLKLDGDDSIVNRHMVASRPDHRSLNTLSAHKVDARPWITGVKVTSNPAIDIYYTPGETIEMTVTYDQEVTVAGDPEFEFSLGSPGAAAGTGDRRAAYDAGASSADSLVFTYTVLPTDEDPNGIWIGDHTRTLKLDQDDSIVNEHDVAPRPDHRILDTQASHRVDPRPRIVDVSVVSSPATTSDTYVSGESIRIAVRYNQGVTVDGDPEFEFSLSLPGAAAGTGDRRAAYDAGASSATSMVFTYTVLPTDEDPDGIWIGNHTRTLKLDTDDKIRNPHGSDARPEHSARNTLSGHKVDGDRNIATLSDLALEDRRAAGVSLVPAFASVTTSYRAVVGRAVDRVTVTATPTNPDADLAWLDENDVALADAGGSADGHQVDLDAGENVVKAKVTAVDGTTMETYVVTVTRRAPVNLAVIGLADTTVAENRTFASWVPSLSGTSVGTVTWTKEGVDAEDFSIAPSTGVVSMVARDFEAPEDDDAGNTYEVTVKATDADDNSAMVSITVTVTDEVESATLAITGLADVSVQENMPWTSPAPTLTGGPIGEVTWSVEGTDAADFTLDPSTGVVSMVSQDFESPADANTDNVYEVTVKATDADDNSAMVSIKVTVTDVEEHATLSITGLADASVEENAPWMSPVPTLTGTPIGEVTWTKEGTDAEDFTINASTGALSMVARNYESPEDDDADNTYEVTVKATDADDNSAMVSIKVTVTDVEEHATLSITGLADASVEENAPWTSPVPTLTGTPIGEVTWTKEGADAADFSINASTGALSMVARDYESPEDDDAGNTYEVTVKATDADDNSAMVSIKVTVTDVEEHATLSITGLPDASVEENAPWMSPVPTLTGTPIGEVTWTKEGTDAEDFTINASTGALSMVARNYESPEDDDADNGYEVTVKATDADDNSATVSITGLSDASVAENDPWTSPVPTLTGTPIGEVTWSKEGADAADFSIDSSTGQLSMVARNYESPEDANTDNVYEVTVKATDADGNTAPKAISVNVTPVAETAALSITGLTDASVPENTPWTSPVPDVIGPPIGDVTWSVEGTDGEDFTINSATGQLSMVVRNYESPADANADNVYEVTVKATDADGNVATKAIEVTVTDVRESVNLSITGLVDANVSENQAWTSPVPSVTGTPIGDVTWSKEGTDAADFSINSATGQLSMVDRSFESPADANTDNVYEVTVKATDADGNVATKAITLTILNVQEQVTLTITGLAVTNVPENYAWTSPVPTLTGTPIGEVTWSKEGTDAADFSIDSSTGRLSMVARDYESPEDDDADNGYEVTVKATDEDGNMATKAITLTIRNVPEQATLGITGLADASVAENTPWTSPVPSVTGGPIGDVTWTKEGDDAADFSIDPSTGQLSMVVRNYEIPADANADNAYEVTVKATDADDNSAMTSITVTVTDVRESATLGITGLVDANAPENQAWTSPVPALTGGPIGDVTWSKEGTDAADFSIDSSTGQLSMVSRNYEDPDDANTDNVYEVTVKATDADGNSAMVSITVTVTDEMESATLGITGLADANAPENAPWTSPAPSVTGGPIGDVTWSKEGTDAADFSIDSSTGQLSMVSRDYEDPDDANTDNVYEVTVKATDADGNTAMVSISLTVTDVQESATLGITGLADASVAENTPWTSPVPSVTGGPIGDVTWTKEGDDAADFSIDPSTGQLSMVVRNYEIPADANADNAYEVTVKATDADDNSAMTSITVTVTDVRESATLGITGLVDANAPENQAWTSPVPALTGGPIGDVTWSKEGTDAADFTINSSTGQLSMVSRDYESPEDDDADNGYEVTVKATDADGNSAMVSITVTVTDEMESATLGITGLADANVSENQAWMSSVPTLTGAPIGDVTWSKEGTDAADFTINSSTGQLSMVSRDYESPEDDDADNGYEVTVKATDEDGNTATKAITLTILNVQEQVTLTITGLAVTSVPENDPWTSPVPTLTGAPIGDVTWSKEGTDAADFSINASTGVLAMVSRDYESPEDDDADNGYEVTVKATDADGNTAMVSITVTVTDQEETATLSITGLEDASVEENQAWTSPAPSVSGGPIGDVTWSVEGTDAEDFSIDSATGVLSMVSRDYESPEDDDADNGYEVTVRVTDADGNTAMVSITMTVTDQEETATLSITGLADASVEENQAWTSTVPTLTGDPIGVETWTKEGVDAEDFSIDSATGVLSMVSRDYESPEDDDADNGYEVTVRVTDADGNTATMAIEVTVTDVQESATLSITGLADTTVAENLAFTSWTPALTGTPVGLVTWGMAGADSADFSIDTSTGVLSMVARDYESPEDDDADNGYEVTLQATDADENRAEKELAVTVTDVTEAGPQGQFSDGDLRLMDGKTGNEGRLEVYHNGEWGTIADDFWTDVESDVACRQLGYDAGSVGNSARFLESHFGGAASDVPIWLDDLQCTGDESRLVDCGHLPWGEHNTQGGEDAGLRCALRRPRVQGVPALSDPGSDMLYGEGETVEVTLTFSEEVTVGTGNGTPTVGIVLGGSTARAASFARGDGTTQLVFAYTLSAPDGSHTSVRVPENSMLLNGGAIGSSDPHGGKIVLAHAGAERGATPPPELTAGFTAVPREHIGVSFAFEVHFSENVVLSQGSSPGSFLDVTGGTVGKAEPLTGSNFGWNVEIDPASLADVTILLSMRPCGSSGAICTADSRVLSNGIDVTVPGPATFSVADAEVREGPGATLDFLVTLSRPKDERTWVYFETGDGTATAGEDYVAEKGHLVFAPGVTSRTASISVLEDAHDEGSETLTLTVTRINTEIDGALKSEMSEVVGIALIGDGTATGTIHNTDPMPKEWIVRFGRTVGGQVVEAVMSRLDGRPTPHVTVGGMRLGGAGPQVTRHTRASHVSLAEWSQREAERPQARSAMANRDLLIRSAFHVSSGGGASAGPSLAAWGRFSTGGFRSSDSGLRTEGGVATGFLGFDASWERLLAGVLVSHSKGDGSYNAFGQGNRQGDVDSRVTGIYSFARFKMSEWFSAWGLAGYGAGELTLDFGGQSALQTDLNMLTGAFGGRAVLLNAGAGGFGLAMKSDLLWVATGSDAVAGLASADGGVTRLRFILEADRMFRVHDGVTLSPGGEVGLRRDGGDAETGTGVEGGARLRLVVGPLTVEGTVRGLLVHQERGYRKWGASGSILLVPVASGRGLSLRLAPSWGDPFSATQRLWSAREATVLAPAEGSQATGRLDAEVGYGFGRRDGVLIPYAGMSVGDFGGRIVTAGCRTSWTGIPWFFGSAATVSLEGAMNATSGGYALNAIRLHGGFGF